eukprot:14318191-Alexandrium_andersonii.AAC.1
MSASLVGSEMCIRDRAWRGAWHWVGRKLSACRHPWWWPCPCPQRRPCAVSYTHLTLPTICSV